MSREKISGGVVHEVPSDFKKALASDPPALAAWEDITPLARNEWICWIKSAKKAETRSRRIAWGCSSLKDGKATPMLLARMCASLIPSQPGLGSRRGLAAMSSPHATQYDSISMAVASLASRLAEYEFPE